MNSQAQNTEEHGNEDQLKARIEALEKELEREREGNKSLKARMRDIRLEEQKKTSEFKSKYEDLLKKTKVRQQITQSKDGTDTGIDRQNEAKSSDEGNYIGRKESVSTISENTVQTDQRDITIPDERNQELEESEVAVDARKGDTRNVKEVNRISNTFQESNMALLKLKQCIERTEGEWKGLQDELQTYERKNKELTDSLNSYKDETQCLKRKLEELQAPNRSTGRAKSIKAHLEEENQRLKEDLDKLRLRLSEVAGSLMLDRNPTIADLSDATRPTKLAEIYSELYNNQWTDALQELEGSEKDATQILLKILLRIHRQCQRLASEYVQQLEFSTITISKSGRTIFKETGEIPASTRKFILEIRKSVSGEFLKELIMHFTTKVYGNDDNSGKQRDGLTKYVEKCIELCWYMAIKDPPVVLGDIPNEGDEVNKDHFAFYTRSGNHIDYCVWPPLLLYKGGELLRKGIVQGK